MRKTIAAIAFMSGILLSTTSWAATIIGGSTLLNTTDANLLESWLGEGPIALTNIFTKQSGDDSVDFHTAVDGQGATFTIIQLDNGNTIGGYNPISWQSASYYNGSGDLSAFLFNLTSQLKLDQSQNIPYQTYNRSNYGPTFGGGHDLYVDSALAGGYANIGHTYAAPPGTSYGSSDARNTFAGSYRDWTITGLEVFSIAPMTPVPLPAGLPLLGSALLGLLAVFGWRGRRAPNGL